MEITLEQIDLLRKRANVSYKEAKEALEKCGGNIVEALAYLEEENKIRPENKFYGDSSFVQKIKTLISKSNKINFTISRNNSIILNIPLTLAVILLIISLPITIAALILALLTNCKIGFNKENGEEYGINKNIESFTSTVNNITSKVTDEFNNTK
jgi:hypothetical protein